jgi:uncharacterized protein YerC
MFINLVVFNLARQGYHHVRMMQATTDMGKLPHEARHERREQVIRLCKSGRTYNEIAAQTGLSRAGAFNLCKLQHDGRYYLPYQLHATKEQFAQAYPKAPSFKLLRKNAGAHRLSNSQWDKYGI